ncbi:formate dehydrogenase accessory sulfurtransferase FdhD [Tepidibacter aestuarii]|uniref:formate dehydrogenase accessory sulfurtransferase FdhD n=1 Tax=Tepidibacter aestuarii TaxID=2925782 RepID=UPI0020C07097|nr:formate dehydrogenase accessory sulfurtransferase FdhD [Tepidibacter aestuarii]CAH2214852.1 Sulfur carrier protein FdhD [Tepidibacter aestuarii]
MDKTIKYDAVKIEENKNIFCEEELVCEYPLNIYVNQKKMATLLCTPDKLKELAFGFLRTEQIIHEKEDIQSIELDKVKGYIKIQLKNDISIKSFQSKKLNMQNNDNNCINDFLDSINCESVTSDIKLKQNKVYEFMKKNLTYSDIFKKTGGVHCVALCDKEGVLIINEDVARHNAVDKVIGDAFLNDIYLKDKIIVLSGRVSLEMILKSAKMQIPIIISKSAPTNLSVKLAKKLGITLVGFVRGEKMNIYANESRII